MMRAVGRLARYLRRLPKNWERERPMLLRPVSLHQAMEQHHLGRLLRYLEVDCVLDVGANLGQYARSLRDHAGYRGRIVSVEPTPSLVDTLRTAAASDPLWSVEALAIGERDGTMPFNVSSERQFSSLSTAVEGARVLAPAMRLGTRMKVAETIDVPVERLSTFVARMKAAHGFERPFLKLDTQGYDMKIVAAAPETMRQFVGLETELSVVPLYVDSPTLVESLARLEALGFALSLMAPNNAGQFPRLLEINGFFVRDDLMPGHARGAALAETAAPRPSRGHPGTRT